MKKKKINEYHLAVSLLLFVIAVSNIFLVILRFVPQGESVTTEVRFYENKDCNLPKEQKHLCGLGKKQLFDVAWHAGKYEFLQGYALVSALTTKEEYLDSFVKGMDYEEKWYKEYLCADDVKYQMCQ